MRKTKIIAVLLLLVGSQVAAAAADNALVPGEIYQLCSYTNFFYNYPSEDFFYFLNDRLLFLEKPDGRIMPNGMRNKLLKIVRWHRLIRKAIQRVKKDKNNMITINVEDPVEFKKAAVILNLLGRRLLKTPEGKYQLIKNPEAGSAEYFEFSMLRDKTLEVQLNKTHHLHIKLTESYVPVPWDYGFLQEITGLKINAANFFETLLKNEQFSLLLGIFYRLSDKEIDYIGSLVKGIHLAAWKEIYNNEKLLMGMFMLSHGLRVKPGGGWMVPGGPQAEAFWSFLARKDCRKTPLGFLHNLALLDYGRLNYFFLFSTFLPPEIQEALFTGANAEKMKEVYRHISLSRQERLNPKQFPGIKDPSFYTFLYSLRMDGDLFFVPQGEEFWIKTISPEITEEFSSMTAGESAPIDYEAELGIVEPGVPEISRGRVIVFGDGGVSAGEDLTGTSYAQYSEIDNKDGSETGAVENSGSETGKPASSKTRIRRLRRSYLAGVRRGYYMKIFGGIHNSDGGDFQAMIDTSKSFFENTTVSNNFLSLGLEAGYSFGRLSLGIEAGRTAKSINSDTSTYYLDTNLKHSLSAWHFLLNAYYKIFGSPSFSAYIYGGGGLYPGQYLREYISDSIGPGYHYDRYTEKSNKIALGYHLGVSFDLFIWKKIALVFDARYRLAAFNDLEGDGAHVTYREIKKYNGTLYFDESQAAGYADFYLGTMRFPGDPSTLRKAELNLDGFALTLGAKWYF